MLNRHALAALALLAVASLAQAAPANTPAPPPPPAAQQPPPPAPADEAPPSGPVFVEQITAEDAAHPPTARQKQERARNKAIGEGVAEAAAAMLHVGLFTTHMLMLIAGAGVLGGIAAGIHVFVRGRRGLMGR